MNPSNQSSLDIADHLGRGEYDWCSEAETRLREQHDLVRQQQAQIKEKDVCLKLLHDQITHLNKMVVYYQDISMSGTHSEEYEEGFWDAVDFVRKAQEK